jgi:hypothetical protein
LDTPSNKGSDQAAGVPVLSDRALNRALLARQLLIDRAKQPAAAVIEHLVGMQAQVPNQPYIGLWTRLQDFQPEELVKLTLDRRVVRLALMRATIHLVTARDCLPLRALMQLVIERNTQGAFGRRLVGIDLAAVAEAGRALVEERPRTFSDLGARLAERWPGRDPLALSQVVRARVPLVQVPPRGIWGASAAAAHAPAETWLRGRRPVPQTLERLVLRYLAAFGPASVMDMQSWSGLTKLRDVFVRLGPNLVTFRDERGQELFDLPEAPRPDPYTPVPPRFLPEYDNVGLGHADRTRMASGHRFPVFPSTGLNVGTVMLDGFGRGRWKIETTPSTSTLIVETVGKLAKADRLALAEEGDRLLSFMESRATSQDVRFVVHA